MKKQNLKLEPSLVKETLKPTVICADLTDWNE